MNAGIYIELNILSSLICILLFYQQKRHKVFDFLGTTAFNVILWLTVFILLMDSGAWLIMMGVLPWNDMALNGFKNVYYLLQALLPMFFFSYCLDVSGYPAKGIWKILMFVPVVLTGILLYSNVYGGWVFYVENATVYRGPAFLAAVVAPVIYILDSTPLCMFFYFSARKKGNTRSQAIAFHILMSILISSAGAVVGAFLYSINPWHVFVTALVYLYIQLHSYQESDLDLRVVTDSLTGLKNSAAYFRVKEKLNKRIAEEPGLRCAVVVMDVNDLKHTNDVYGHEAGNALIIAASRILCEVFEHSPVYRIGGDEFVAILENSDYERREELCAEFSRRLAESCFTAGDKKLPVSASLGKMEYNPECHEAFEHVFHAADELMYANKALLKRSRNA